MTPKRLRELLWSDEVVEAITPVTDFAAYAAGLFDIGTWATMVYQADEVKYASGVLAHHLSDDELESTYARWALETDRSLNRFNG